MRHSAPKISIDPGIFSVFFWYTANSVGQSRLESWFVGVTLISFLYNLVILLGQSADARPYYTCVGNKTQGSWNKSHISGQQSLTIGAKTQDSWRQLSRSWMLSVTGPCPM